MTLPETGMQTPARCPALLIAAPASGQGKTTVTAALARLMSPKRSITSSRLSMVSITLVMKLLRRTSPAQRADYFRAQVLAPNKV